MIEADIPVDIHVSKLQEWLISRRIVPKNWNAGIRGVRNKINEAINDMPAHDGLIKLLSGAHINYFHCLQIIEILKQTEVDSKNLFGRYDSKRMKDWQEVLKLYEKDSIYIAEAAQILTRNIMYEIPGMKKQSNKLLQLTEDGEKQVKDLKKNENTLKNEYVSMCQQLGIKGENLREELIEKLKDLPGMYDIIIEKSRTLKKALSLYTDFAGDLKCLPILKFIATSGNKTVYEYLYGVAPISIEEPIIDFSPTTGIDSNLQKRDIDFGDIEGVEADIDFEIVSIEEPEIDWASVQTIDTQPEDFEIDIKECGISVESSNGQPGGTAKGDEAFCLLDLPHYRNLFINDIEELKSFFKMRLFELNSAINSKFVDISSIDHISANDESTLLEMLCKIEELCGATMNNQLQNLHNIKHSKNYVDILSAKLEQKMKGVSKLEISRKSLDKKIVGFRNEMQNMKSPLQRLIDQTRVLQDQIEKDISKRYKNRVVNMMGGIATLQ